MSGYPGLAAGDTDLRRIVGVVRRLLTGKMNAVTSVTLTANAATTTLTDRRLGGASYIGFSPTTAHGAAEIPTLYVSAKATGSATLTHANNAQTDRTFDVLIIG